MPASSIKVVLKMMTLLAFAASPGCWGSDEDRVNSGQAMSGELRLGVIEPHDLDPAVALGNEVGITRQLFRGLLWYNERLKLVPMVAKEVPSVENGGISKDGLVYRFHLRDDFKWSDGRLVTAADFEYSIKRMLLPKPSLAPSSAGSLAQSYYDITGAESLSTCSGCSQDDLTRLLADVGVKATDDKTLVITLSRPNAEFLHVLGLVAPVRRDIIEQYGDDWTRAGNLIGNGPFVLKEWLPGQAIVMESNPYWQASQVRLARVIVSFVASPFDRFDAYQRGDLDMIESFPDLEPAEAKSAALTTELIKLPSMVSFALFLNQSREPFSNVIVREAFSLAIDREALATGSMEVGYGWLPPGVPGYDKDAGREWSYNPERARHLLAEAGYPGGQGLPPLRYIYVTGVTNLQGLVGRFVRDALQRELGVKVELKGVEPDSVPQLLAAGDYDIILAPSLSLAPDAGSMLMEYWGCERYEGQTCTSFSILNRSRYANPEFDRLMQQARKELDESRRLDLYTRAHRLLLSEAPAIFLGHVEHNVSVKPYIGGAVHTPLDSIPGEFYLDRVFIKE
jgi:oligopeptide transport system substrate-binding protein